MSFDEKKQIGRRNSTESTGSQRPAAGSEKETKETPTIVFDGFHEPSKTATQGLKLLHAMLKSNFTVVTSRDEFSKSKLQASQIRCLVLTAPKKPFEANEVAALRDYLTNGGRVLVMGLGGEDEEAELIQNQLNAWLSAYGVTMEHDAVIRTVYRRDYYNPREVYIKDSAVVTALEEAAQEETEQHSRWSQRLR